MRTFDKAVLSFYGLLVLAMGISVSCVKQKEPEMVIRTYDLPELDEEDIDDLPEDTAEKQLERR
jgi:hypothetical protein